MTKQMILAQCNVALFRWPLDDPRMAEFVARIDSTYALAETSPGFVWRFSGDHEGELRAAPYNSPLLFFNMSVWRDVHALREFVKHPIHLELLQSKERWTQPAPSAPQVMWWIDAQATPSVDEGLTRLAALTNGDATAGFTFENPQPPNEVG